MHLIKKGKINGRSVLGSGGDGLLILFHVAGRHVLLKKIKIQMKKKKKLQENRKKKTNEIK